jgi:peptide/nickel transport system substrate-binding protein
MFAIMSDTPLEGSLNRRSFLKVSAAFAATASLASLITACADDDTDDDVAAVDDDVEDTDDEDPDDSDDAVDDDADDSEPAAAGGDIVVGLVAEPVSMDPAQVSDINSMRVHRSMYDALVQFAPASFDIEGALAESWDISDDEQSYTFELREDVEFHDGTPFNAEAVKFNFDRMLDDSHPAYDTGPFPFSATYFASVEEVEVVDEFTVAFHLSQIYAPLINNLATATAFISSPTAIEEHGQDYSQNPVGTGPFRFDSWESSVRVTLVKNEDYWGGAPNLDTLVFRPITEEQTRITELMSGGVNFIVDVPPDNIEQITDAGEFEFVEQTGPHIWWLSFNHNAPPFDDHLVRQAANYAVNKQAIVDHILQGTGTVANTVIPSAIDWAYNPDAHEYPYDPDRARELLEEAGYGDGVNTIMWIPESGSGMQSPRAMGEAIQADLEQVGIIAEIVVMEWGAYLNEYEDGMGDDVGLAAMSWMFGSGDPDTVLPLSIATSAHPPNGFNTGYYSNERVDELIELAQGTTDIEERGEHYRELQEITSEEAVWLFIDHSIQNAAMTNDIQGFELSPTFLIDFRGVSIG